MIKYVVLVVILWIGLFEKVNASCKGCVELDSLTFDKMLNKFEYSLIKFDISYPYGPKHDAYETFATDAASQSELLVGIVGVKDYGKVFFIKPTTHFQSILLLQNRRKGQSGPSRSLRCENR